MQLFFPIWSKLGIYLAQSSTILRMFNFCLVKFQIFAISKGKIIDLISVLYLWLFFLTILICVYFWFDFKMWFSRNVQICFFFKAEEECLRLSCVNSCHFGYQTDEKRCYTCACIHDDDGCMFYLKISSKFSSDKQKRRDQLVNWSIIQIMNTSNPLQVIPWSLTITTPIPMQVIFQHHFRYTSTPLQLIQVIL